MKKGFFVVVEGISGEDIGRSVISLHNHARVVYPHTDILTTQEPWNKERINEFLTGKDSENIDALTHCYVADREVHLKRLINPFLENGGIVICNRYSMSTYAFQGEQGESFGNIRELHERNNIRTPDATIVLSGDIKTINQRTDLSKNSLTMNPKSLKSLILNYANLASIGNVDLSLFGRVLSVPEDSRFITGDVSMAFDIIYKQHQASSFLQQ